MSMEAVKTRTQAKLDGDKYYSTGKECLHGHWSERYTSNGNCVECGKANKSDDVATHRIKLFIIKHPGYSVQQIAKILDFTEEYVRCMFRALNIPRSGKPENYVG